MRLTIALVATLVALASAASGQGAQNGATFRDWTIACRAAAVGQTDCVLSQVLVKAETQELVAEVSLAPASGTDAEAIVLLLRVPTGVVLPQKPEFAVLDQGVEAEMDWLTCDDRYCTAARTLDGATLSGLRRGATARLGYRRMGTDTPAIFDISLLGVTAGLAALRPEE